MDHVESVSGLRLYTSSTTEVGEIGAPAWQQLHQQGATGKTWPSPLEEVNL